MVLVRLEKSVGSGRGEMKVVLGLADRGSGVWSLDVGVNKEPTVAPDTFR